MLIVMIILIILAVVLCAILMDEYEILAGVCVVCAVILGIAAVFTVIVICSYFINGVTAKNKVEMYQEENKIIEQQIDTLVKNYMEYEGKTLKDFKSESSITLVTMYPELKSDTLVKEQIKTYIKNNTKIKELKEAQIDLKIGKWLLYFGK